MRNNDYIAHGDFVYRHSPAPVFVKAERAVMEDSDGRRYFCAEAANGTTSLGFDASISEEAMLKTRSLPSIPSFCETDIRLKVGSRLGKKIQDITGQSGMLAFELGGAQGVELALRIAKANKKKSQFIVFEGGYHGRSVYTAQFSASHRYRAAMGDWRVPITRLPYPDYEQSGSSLTRAQWKEQYFSYLNTLVTRETGGIFTNGGEQDIAALVIEPMLNAGGIVKPDKDLFEKIVATFKKLGALVIVDEIFCGFHRTGPMFGFQHYDIDPDIIVMSKAITNGITPLSCVWAKDPLLSSDAFPPGSHSATFINQPFGLAVADTVLDRYESWKTIDRDIEVMQDALESMIREVLSISKHAKSGFSLGGTGRILLRQNDAGQILDIARSVAWQKPVNGVHGLILASTGMASNVIALNPPLTLTPEELATLRELLLQTFHKANTEVK